MNEKERRVYFAHPKYTYKTLMEKKALQIILEKFPDAKIINPSKYTYFEHATGMRLFKRFVKHSHILVYTDLAGFITAGVAVEIEEAKKKGIEIYRLEWRTGKLEKVEKIRGYILDPAKTWRLYEILKKLGIDDEILNYKINETIKRYKSIDRWGALEIVLYESKPKKKEDEIQLNPIEKYYHWWQEPEYIQLPIDNKKLTKLVQDKIKEENLNNIGELLRKYHAKQFEASYHYLYRILNNMVSRSTVKGLKRLCNQLKIPYIELEERKIFPEHDFPYNQADHTLWKLATHVLNEGSIDKKNVISYSNKDPVLHWYFKKAVLEAGGEYHGPYKIKNKLVYESHSDSLTGRRLIMIGVPQGKKTIHEPTLDLSKMTSEVWKYHIQTTLTEEGSASLRLSRGKWLAMYIELERAVDVTRYIPSDILSVLKPGNYRIGMISREIPELHKILKEHPPKLLLSEYRELVKRDLSQLYPKIYPFLHIWNLHISKDYRATAEWKLVTGNKAIVDTIATRYGMLPGTWKDYVFKKQYEFYVKYRGKALSENEIDKYHEIRRKYNYRGLNREWIDRKIEEFFGGKS